MNRAAKVSRDERLWWHEHLKIYSQDLTQTQTNVALKYLVGMKIGHKKRIWSVILKELQMHSQHQLGGQVDEHSLFIYKYINY